MTVYGSYYLATPKLERLNGFIFIQAMLDKQR